MSVEQFDGFPPPESNYFRLPNCFIDLLSSTKSLSELKVVLYTMRHTWGYGEYERMRKISLDEFQNGRKMKGGARIDDGCGLSEPSVIKGLKDAIEHGYLERIVDGNDKARARHFYRVRMAKESLPQIPRTLTAELKNVGPRSKETLARTRKDNVRKTIKSVDPPDRNGSSGYSEAFLCWYKAYPRHVEKLSASRKYEKAVDHVMKVEQVTKEEAEKILLDAATRYAAAMEGEEARFIKHPTTWLNGGCWDDEVPTRKSKKWWERGYDSVSYSDQTSFREKVVMARNEIVDCWEEDDLPFIPKGESYSKIEEYDKKAVEMGYPGYRFECWPCCVEFEGVLNANR